MTQLTRLLTPQLLALGRLVPMSLLGVKAGIASTSTMSVPFPLVNYFAS